MRRSAVVSAGRLHDELGPTVAGLSMQLGALRHLVRTDPDVVVDRLDALHASATQALADIRRVAHDLRPALDQLGLAGGLRQLAEALGLRARIDADLPLCRRWWSWRRTASARRR